MISLGFIAQKSGIYSPIACCLLNLTPFSLPPRNRAHNLISAGVGTFRNSRARLYPFGVVRFAGISWFYPTLPSPNATFKLPMNIQNITVAFGEGVPPRGTGGVRTPQQVSLEDLVFRNGFRGQDTKPIYSNSENHDWKYLIILPAAFEGLGFVKILFPSPSTEPCHCEGVLPEATPSLAEKPAKSAFSSLRRLLRREIRTSRNDKREVNNLRSLSNSCSHLVFLASYSKTSLRRGSLDPAELRTASSPLR